MPLVPVKDLMLEAQKDKHAIGMFVIVDASMTEAAIKAAEDLNAPIMLGFGNQTRDLVSIKNLACNLWKPMAEASSAPVVIHFDHGDSLETCKEAISLGFTSFMIDASHLPFEENIAVTKEVADYCRKHGVTCEAELGALGGEFEEGAQAVYTDPEQAAEFVERTGIDCLAVSIGNAHGQYKGKPDIQFEILKQIKERVSVPLVLHGASGIPDEDIKKAVEMGICKVNIHTEFHTNGLPVIEDTIENKKYYSNYAFLAIKGIMREVAYKTVKEKITLFGSNGKGFN